MRTLRRWVRALVGNWRRVAGVVVLVAAVVGGWPLARAVREAREAQHRQICSERLKKLGVAFHESHAVEGHFPGPAVLGRDGTPRLSWRVAVLPRLGMKALYDEFHLDEPWDSPHNRTLIPKMPAVFACPAGRGAAGHTHLRVVVGPKAGLGVVGTAFEPGRGLEDREFLDGTSHTVLVAEAGEAVPWTKPDELAWEPGPGRPLPRFGAHHPGGFHVLFADGSVRFLRRHTIQPSILAALLTSNGLEVEVVSSA